MIRLTIVGTRVGDMKNKMMSQNI